MESSKKKDSPLDRLDNLFLDFGRIMAWANGLLILGHCTAGVASLRFQQRPGCSGGNRMASFTV